MMPLFTHCPHGDWFHQCGELGADLYFKRRREAHGGGVIVLVH